MRTQVIAALLVLPAFVSAQDSVITSVSTGVSLGPDRNPVTFSQTLQFTVTASPSGTQSAGNGTASSASGNSTLSQNATTTSRATTTSILPTAPTNVPGGGAGPQGAPSPGATAPGGVFGPDDGYISGGSGLRSLCGMVGVIGAVVGGALVLL